MSYAIIISGFRTKTSLFRYGVSVLQKMNYTMRDNNILLSVSARLNIQPGAFCIFSEDFLKKGDLGAHEISQRLLY